MLALDDFAFAREVNYAAAPDVVILDCSVGTQLACVFVCDLQVWWARERQLA